MKHNLEHVEQLSKYLKHVQNTLGDTSKGLAVFHGSPLVSPWKKIEVLNQKYLQKGTWDGKAILHKLNPPPVPSGFFRMEKAKHEAKMENGVLQGGLRGQLSMVNLSASLACSPTCLSSCTSVGRDFVVTTGIRPKALTSAVHPCRLCAGGAVSYELRAYHIMDMRTDLPVVHPV